MEASTSFSGGAFLPTDTLIRQVFAETGIKGTEIEHFPRQVILDIFQQLGVYNLDSMRKVCSDKHFKALCSDNKILNQVAQYLHITQDERISIKETIKDFGRLKEFLSNFLLIEENHIILKHMDPNIRYQDNGVLKTQIANFEKTIESMKIKYKNDPYIIQIDKQFQKMKSSIEEETTSGEILVKLALMNIPTHACVQTPQGEIKNYEGRLSRGTRPVMYAIETAMVPCKLLAGDMEPGAFDVVKNIKSTTTPAEFDTWVNANKEVGYTLESGGRLGWTALHRAALVGNSELVKHILQASDAKKILNMGNMEGETPLFILCNQCRNPEASCAIAKAMIKAGANVNIAATKSSYDLNPPTPLKAALDHGDSRLARLLLRSGASMHITLAPQSQALLDKILVDEARRFRTQMTFQAGARKNPQSILNRLPADIRKMIAKEIDKGEAELQLPINASNHSMKKKN